MDLRDQVNGIVIRGAMSLQMAPVQGDLSTGKSDSEPTDNKTLTYHEELEVDDTNLKIETVPVPDGAAKKKRKRNKKRNRQPRLQETELPSEAHSESLASQGYLDEIQPVKKGSLTSVDEEEIESIVIPILPALLQPEFSAEKIQKSDCQWIHENPPLPVEEFQGADFENAASDSKSLAVGEDETYDPEPVSNIQSNQVSSDSIDVIYQQAAEQKPSIYIAFSDVDNSVLTHNASLIKESITDLIQQALTQTKKAQSEPGFSEVDSSGQVSMSLYEVPVVVDSEKVHTVDDYSSTEYFDSVSQENIVSEESQLIEYPGWATVDDIRNGNYQMQDTDDGWAPDTMEFTPLVYRPCPKMSLARNFAESSDNLLAVPYPSIAESIVNVDDNTVATQYDAVRHALQEVAAQLTSLKPEEMSCVTSHDSISCDVPAAPHPSEAFLDKESNDIKEHVESELALGLRILTWKSSHPGALAEVKSVLGNILDVAIRQSEELMKSENISLGSNYDYVSSTADGHSASMNNVLIFEATSAQEGDVLRQDTELDPGSMSNLLILQTPENGEGSNGVTDVEEIFLTTLSAGDTPYDTVEIPEELINIQKLTEVPSSESQILKKFEDLEQTLLEVKQDIKGIEKSIQIQKHFSEEREDDVEPEEIQDLVIPTEIAIEIVPGILEATEAEPTICVDAEQDVVDEIEEIQNYLNDFDCSKSLVKASEINAGFENDNANFQIDFVNGIGENLEQDMILELNGGPEMTMTALSDDEYFDAKEQQDLVEIVSYAEQQDSTVIESYAKQHDSVESESYAEEQNSVEIESYTEKKDSVELEGYSEEQDSMEIESYASALDHYSTLNENSSIDGDYTDAAEVTSFIDRVLDEFLVETQESESVPNLIRVSEQVSDIDQPWECPGKEALGTTHVESESSGPPAVMENQVDDDDVNTDAFRKQLDRIRAIRDMEYDSDWDPVYSPTSESPVVDKPRKARSVGRRLADGMRTVFPCIPRRKEGLALRARDSLVYMQSSSSGTLGKTQKAETETNDNQPKNGNAVSLGQKLSDWEVVNTSRFETTVVSSTINGICYASAHPERFEHQRKHEMRSAIGVNSVRATLEKSLLRAQKRFNQSNPASAAKETKIQEKIKERKLHRKLLNIARQNRLLCGSSRTDEEVASDWSDLVINPIHLEFEPARDSYEDFIKDFEEQFNKFCNTAEPTEKQSTAQDTALKKKHSIKGESKKLRKLRKILKKTKLAAPLQEAHDGQEDLIPGSKSKLQLLRERRLKIRQIRKAIKKEARRLREEAKQTSVVQADHPAIKNKKVKKTMKDMTVSCGNGDIDVAPPCSSGLDSSKTNVIAKLTLIPNGIVKKTVEPQLPKPKFTIFQRDRVQLGWAQKYRAGCGFINLGNSCYMNATLQAVFHIPSFVNWLLSDKQHQKQCQNSQRYLQCMVCAMRSTLEESLGGRQCIRPGQIHSKLRMISQNFVQGRQEDAHEFLRHLLESMEVAYLRACGGTNLDIRSKETTPLGQIFGGYLRTEVTCLKCQHVSTTFQPLAELQLDIRHATSVAEAVGYHFRKEKVDNNDYKCEGCRNLTPVIKQFSLELPPNVLCLQLKRFTLFGGKLGKAIQCNRELDLTRFLHSSQSSHYPNSLKYRMVSLITHIGSSPNGGHYTAIAESSSGGVFHFDDSFVRSIPALTTDSVSSDAYVIMYEKVDSSRVTNTDEASVKSATQIVNHPASNTLNGFSSQKFAKPSTSTLPNSNQSTKSIKFVFNQGSKLVNPFATNKLDKNPTPPMKVLPITMPKIVSANGPTNGNKTLPTEVKAKAERTPVSFTLKGNTGAAENPSKFSGVVRSVQTLLKRSFQPLEQKSRSPNASNGASTCQSKPSTNPISLVPYDDDDESPSTTPNRQSRERSATPKTVTEPPKPKFDSKLVSTQIKGWDNAASTLSKAMEVSRKRDLETARADAYNEELDVGRTKKQKLNNSQQNRDTPGFNKFQNYEDQRRLVNERTKSLMITATKPLAGNDSFVKDPYRSHHQGHSNNGVTNSRSSYHYNNPNQSREGDASYQSEQYRHRENSYNFGNGGFKRHNSAPTFHSRVSDNRSHHSGTRGFGHGSWGHHGKHHYNKSRHNSSNHHRR